MSAARKLNFSEQDYRALLRTFSLFKEADDLTLDFALRNMEEMHIEKGQPIILQGESSDHVYFIRSGQVEILNYLAEERRSQRVTLLGKGANFGEFSVLRKGIKSSSAYAYEDCDLLRIHGPQFMQLMQGFPSIAKNLVKMLAELNSRVEANSEFIQNYSHSMLNVSPAVMELLPQAQWRRLGLVPIELRNGLLTVATKDVKASALIETLGARPIDVAVYQIEESDMEEALAMAANPSTRTKGAKTESLSGAPDIYTLLKGHTVFKDFPEETLQQFKNHLPPQEIKRGTIFAKPGYKFEAIYLVWRGLLHVGRPIQKARTLAPVLKLGPGSFLGEVAVLGGGGQPFVVRALEDTIVIPIPVGVVDQLLSSPVFTIPLAVHLEQRLQQIGKIAGIQYYKAESAPNFKEVRHLVPYPIMLEQRVMPLEIRDGEVILGTVHNSQGVLSIIGRYLADYRVRLVSITDAQFQSWFSSFASVKEKREAETTLARMTVGDAPVTHQDPLKLLDELLLTGYNGRASDIHFEPFERDMTVRYRVDGVLVERPEKIPTGVAKQIISRLKVLSNMDISNHRTPQDGQMKTVLGDVNFVARASSLPVKHGEKVVLRVIRSRASVIPLNMLVPDRRTIQILQNVARSPQGLFLVTGPTGSGKTTSLYSVLSNINRVEVNITTIEDPVEMEIQGCNQIEVDRKKGLDFASALRSVLRQDPDVIMVGEIRDEESAKIVLEAAITGHLVISTLHTDSSLDVPARLKEFGIAPSHLAAGLLGVLTQRLVRAICKKCISTRPINPGEKRLIESVLGAGKAPEEMYYGKGCPTCQNSGYYDRIPVFEVWRKTLEVNNALLNSAGLIELKTVVKQDGFETLFEFGVKMAVLGLTTIEEVERNLSNV